MEPAVGLVAIALAWGLAGAQWWRARTSAAGISVLAWALFLATNTAWLVYAVEAANWYLLVNAVGSSVINASLLWRIDAHRWRSYAAVGVFTPGCAAVATWTGPAPLAAVCFSIAFAVRWPQLVVAARADDLSGISLASWTLAAVNNVAWVAVGVLGRDWWFAGAQTALASVTVGVIVTVAVRRGARDGRGSFVVP